MSNKTNTKKTTKTLKSQMVQIVAKTLQSKRGANQSISNSEIQTILHSQGFMASDGTVRGIIRTIRMENKVSNLIANHRGYYVSSSKTELWNYLDQLKGKAQKINLLCKTFEKNLAAKYR